MFKLIEQVICVSKKTGRVREKKVVLGEFSSLDEARSFWDLLPGVDSRCIYILHEC